jgi:hypothetical protein
MPMKTVLFREHTIIGSEQEKEQKRPETDPASGRALKKIHRGY